MIEIRRSAERGHANHGWLDSHHTFSFADYHDPAHMGFSHLRVINEDRVNPGSGFPTHSHRDMEIITYIIDGELEHKDSMGNGSIIRPGDVQRMSAGTGVRHSEFNPSASETVHFLQIWILPDTNGLAPGYEQRHFGRAELDGRLRVVASRDGREDSVAVHQDMNLYAVHLGRGQQVKHSLASGRCAYVQVARGSLELNGRQLLAGDGAGVSKEMELRLEAGNDAEVLVFDLA